MASVRLSILKLERRASSFCATMMITSLTCSFRRQAPPQSPPTLRQAQDTALGGKFQKPLEVNLTAVVVDEITLVGSRCGPFAPALRLLERGLVQVAPLIQARYTFSEVLTAFEHAAQPGTLKVLVTREV